MTNLKVWRFTTCNSMLHLVPVKPIPFIYDMVHRTCYISVFSSTLWPLACSRYGKTNTAISKCSKGVILTPILAFKVDKICFIDILFCIWRVSYILLFYILSLLIVNLIAHSKERASVIKMKCFIKGKASRFVKEQWEKVNPNANTASYLCFLSTYLKKIYNFIPLSTYWRFIRCNVKFRDAVKTISLIYSNTSLNHLKHYW